VTDLHLSPAIARIEGTLESGKGVEWVQRGERYILRERNEDEGKVKLRRSTQEKGVM